MLSFTSIKPLSRNEDFGSNRCTLVTSGTFQKRPFIVGDERKGMLLESLDFNCYKWTWRILAYVILDNHYHLVVTRPDDDMSRLAHIIQSAHSYSAHHWRRDDPTIRSRIWWNFWDSPIDDVSLLLRHINYLHANPQFHGVAQTPGEYVMSSYALYRKLDPATLEQWQRDYPHDGLGMIDNF